MIGKRPLWPYLAGAAAVLAVVVFLVVRLSGPELLPVAPAGGEMTIAGDVTLEQTGPTVSARITISADRTVTLRKLVVKVRDEAGAFHDFPELADVQVDTASRPIRVSRELAEPGTYTYYLAYERDGAWVSLPPWQLLTVR